MNMKNPRVSTSFRSLIAAGLLTMAAIANVIRVYVGGQSQLSMRNRIPPPKPLYSERMVLPTAANRSSYHVINHQETYGVNDRIKVLIQARDISGSPQPVGGAYFRAKLMSADIKAASRSDGEIIDFDNGTYLAEFVLRWSGKVSVRVMLVDGVLAVNTLRRIREEFPNRGSYIGHFKNGTSKQSMECNVDHVAKKEEECDFSDGGVPWFCKKPTLPHLSCEHWSYHDSNNTYIDAQQKNYIRQGEGQYFDKYKNYLICTNCVVNVIDNSSKGGEPSWMQQRISLPPCLPEVHNTNVVDFTTSGYYYKNVWYSTRCQNQHFQNTKVIRHCLKNKTILLLGDSTTRQIQSKISKLVKGRVIKPVDCMAHTSLDDINFHVYWKFHALPVRGTRGENADCLRHNIPWVLEHMNFLPNVLVLTLGAHFTIHGVEFFTQRIRLIREAVERLHRRNPNMIFILKTDNTREFETLSHILSNNEWYLYTLDRIFRQVFSDYPKTVIVDAWDMTVTQFYPDNIHPKDHTVNEIVSLIFSYVCPIKTN